MTDLSAIALATVEVAPRTNSSFITHLSSLIKVPSAFSRLSLLNSEYLISYSVNMNFIDPLIRYVCLYV